MQDLDYFTPTHSAGNRTQGHTYTRKQFTTELLPDPELSFYPIALIFTTIQDWCSDSLVLFLLWPVSPVLLLASDSKIHGLAHCFASTLWLMGVAGWTNHLFSNEPCSINTWEQILNLKCCDFFLIVLFPIKCLSHVLSPIYDVLMITKIPSTLTVQWQA